MFQFQEKNMPETLATLAALRSIHGNFSDQEVTPADLDTILTCALRAANASNRQSYSIVVINDPPAILECCGYTGSKALLFCVDTNRLAALAAHTGRSFAPGGPVAFVTGAVDAILAAQAAAVAAKGLGIDSLFTNGIHRRGSRSTPEGSLEATARQFDLPAQYCFPLILLVLGYAEAEPPHLRGRVREGVIHHDRYQPLSPAALDEQVRAYDDPSSRLAPGQGWAAEGFAHYLDWYFEKWAVRGNPAAKDREFAEYLKKTGFIE